MFVAVLRDSFVVAFEAVDDIDASTAAGWPKLSLPARILERVVGRNRRSQTTPLDILPLFI